MRESHQVNGTVGHGLPADAEAVRDAAGAVIGWVAWVEDPPVGLAYRRGWAAFRGPSALPWPWVSFETKTDAQQALRNL